MGAEQSQIQERQQSSQALDQKINSCIQSNRFQFSHQVNVWSVCRRLAESYANWQISQIHLDNNMIAGEVIEELCKINFQKSPLALKALTLSYNDISCDSLKHFRGAFFGTLMVLHLDHNRIGSDGCFYISKTNLPRLETLDLSHNLINANAAGHLANTNLPKLIHLIINHNQLTVSALHSLSQAHWPSLALLQAKENLFEPTKDTEAIKFRTEVKMFQLQLR